MKKTELKQLIKEVLLEIGEPSTQKRYVVTADFYVWANDDKEAKREAQKIMSELKDQYDNNASVITIHEQPFGSRDSKSI